MSQFLKMFMIHFALATYSMGQDIEMPPECNGKSFCNSKPKDYDFIMEDIDSKIYPNKYWAGRGPRYSEDFQPLTKPDSQNCGYKVELHRPYIIRVNDTNPQNKLVVQTKYLQQEIKYVTCQEPQSCFGDLMSATVNLNSTCEQSYTKITLYIYDNGSIKAQPFRIPVSCYCKVYFIDI